MRSSRLALSAFLLATGFAVLARADNPIIQTKYTADPVAPASWGVRRKTAMAWREFFSAWGSWLCEPVEVDSPQPFVLP